MSTVARGNCRGCPATTGTSCEKHRKVFLWFGSDWGSHTEAVPAMTTAACACGDCRHKASANYGTAATARTPTTASASGYTNYASKSY
jgi:hypothetical protein